jgi:predicted DsbA family dithiol-disulfide isomerase
MDGPLFIDVVSDVVCPWCYIGKRQLDMAIAQRPDCQIDVRWRPFQLDATIPDEGVDRKAYYAQKFPNVENRRQRMNQVQAAGAAVGLDLAFDKIERTPNTLNAHRLLHWASGQGVQSEVKEDLFQAYFSQGRDLTNVQTLIDIGARHGLSPDLLGSLFASESDCDVVRAQISQAQHIGVTGVPVFIFHGQFALTGAQPVEALVDAIDQTLESRTKTENSVIREPQI